MEASMDGRPQGKKRPFPVEREMEKCETCRRKRIKCLPVDRDWSKREKCSACERHNDPCGPNVRAYRSVRSKKSPQTASPNERPLAPFRAPSVSRQSHLLDSVSPPTGPTQLGHPGHLELGGHSSNRQESGTDADSRASNRANEAQPDDSGGQKISIKSCLVQIGEIRMTLQSLEKRVSAFNASASKAFQASTPSKSEPALDILANSLQVQYSNTLQQTITLIQDAQPGPWLEVPLRRTLDAIEDFADLAKIAFELDAAPSNRLRKWQCFILKRLVETYEEQEDAPEAERFAQKLGTLQTNMKSSDSDTTRRLAESLVRSSRRMRHIMTEVHLPSKYRSSLHLSDGDPFPSLHRAMLDQNPAVVRHLCDTAPQVLQEQDILKRGALHIAAETSNEDVLDHLRPDLPDLFTDRDLCWLTPLFLAVYRGDHEYFLKMLRHSSPNDLESKDGEGRSLLTVACGHGHTRIVDFLLKKSISPNDDPLGYCSPLHAAASSGRADICRALLDSGAWVDWCSQDQTPAEAAKTNGHDCIVAMIQKYQGNPANLWTTDQRHTRSLSQTSGAICSPLLDPATPQQQLLGNCSPPPSFRDAPGAAYDSAVSNLPFESDYDYVDPSS